MFENRSAAKNTFVRTLGRFCRKYHLAELSYPLLDEREKPKSSCRNLHFPYAESGVYPLYTVPEAQADPSSRHQPDATDFANVAARIDEGFLGQAEVLKCDARREGQRLTNGGEVRPSAAASGCLEAAWSPRWQRPSAEGSSSIALQEKQRRAKRNTPG